MIFDEIERSCTCIVQQVKARRKARKRPPLGLLVIAKLTLK